MYKSLSLSILVVSADFANDRVIIPRKRRLQFWGFLVCAAELRQRRSRGHRCCGGGTTAPTRGAPPSVRLRGSRFPIAELVKRPYIYV